MKQVNKKKINSLTPFTGRRGIKIIFLLTYIETWKKYLFIGDFNLKGTGTDDKVYILENKTFAKIKHEYLGEHDKEIINFVIFFCNYGKKVE